MKKYLFIIAILVVLLIGQVSLFAQDNSIQLAILLDTSNSMDGLIDQAKTQLWNIVNQLSTAKINGKSPDIEVALYEYGNDRLSGSTGFIRQVVPLTTDLDLISEKLFELTTNGGSEYCGYVINDAVDDLKWSKSNKILKVIYIAGNEEFTQGPVNYKESCKKAISKGIIVNTIFCGNTQEGINTFWKDGALLADGSYLSIEQDNQYVYIEAPQDKEIIKLNEKLNSTYIAYGDKGDYYKKRQTKQDKNASGMNDEVAIQRSVTKSSKNYSNSQWDLIDGVDEKTVDLSKIKDKDLPKEMRHMSLQEKKDYIVKLKKERDEIKAKIKKLNGEREKYLIKERKKQANKNMLDTAIVDSIKKQAKKKGYQF